MVLEVDPKMAISRVAVHEDRGLAPVTTSCVQVSGRLRCNLELATPGPN